MEAYAAVEAAEALKALEVVEALEALEVVEALKVVEALEALEAVEAAEAAEAVEAVRPRSKSTICGHISVGDPCRALARVVHAAQQRGRADHRGCRGPAEMLGEPLRGNNLWEVPLVPSRCLAAGASLPRPSSGLRSEPTSV